MAATVNTGLEPAALLPAVASVVRTELAAVRGCPVSEVGLTATPETPLDRSQDGVDSLVLIRLATAVSRAFCLDDLGIDDGLLVNRRLGAWAELVAQALSQPGARLRFSTSGSTGEPKTVEHALDDLCLEATFLATRWAKGGRVVSLVPAHHLYGFIFTTLLPRYLHADAVWAPNAADWARLEFSAGDLIVGFPTAWGYLTATCPELPGDAAGVCSTAPCEAGIIDHARALGLAGITEVFGSTETAGLGWRDDPRRAYRLMPHWRRSADGRTLERCGADGQWRAHPGPEDRLEWQDGEHFLPGGRQDGAVQVGGYNVFPRRIAAVLEQHPLVHACQVRPMRSDEGDRLKAFVVLAAADGDWSQAAQTLRRWCGERLNPAECPMSFRFGDALPRTALGKLADW